MAAVIFDMDGVLVDGEPLHYAAINEILGEEAIQIDIPTYRRYLGTTLAHTWRDLAARHALAHDYAYYARRYDVAVTAQYRAHAVPTPGAHRLLARLQEAGVPCALASSSNRAWVETALAALDMGDAFDVVISGDEVREGKPDPEIYRTAAARLGVPPADCLVIEDAPAGIEAARGAGMRVIGVRTEMTEGLPLSGAERIIDSLEAFDLAWLNGGDDA